MGVGSDFLHPFPARGCDGSGTENSVVRRREHNEVVFVEFAIGAGWMRLRRRKGVPREGRGMGVTDGEGVVERKFGIRNSEFGVRSAEWGEV